MAATVASFQYALKVLYPQSRVFDLTYQDRPALAMIPKKSGFEGRSINIALRYGNAQGRSGTFTTAQARAVATNSNGLQFAVTRVRDYSVFTMDTEVLAAAKTNRGSFLKSMDDNVEGAYNVLANSISKQLFRDGVGERGQVSVSALVLTLLNAEDVVHFEVGEQVVASTGATKTAVLRGTPTGAVITAVDRNAGTITIASNPDTITTNDHLFKIGDRQTAAITASAQWQRISGFEGWIPPTAPAPGESFFGQDRSPDPTRNAGIIQDVSTSTPTEAYTIALSRAARDGAFPTTAFVNFLDLRNLTLDAGNKVQMVYSSIGSIGFNGHRIRGPKQELTIYPDRDCPFGVGWLLTPETWCLHHLDELMNFQDYDGNVLSREASADRYEGRLNFFGNLACYAPGLNSRIALPA